jgi:RHS repeat-associated protein
MITDKNKNITEIVYNQLNLPTKITFGTTGTIEYIYNAAGQKLEKIVTQGTTVTSTNYLGGFQYTKPNLGTWALQFFPTAEGYVKNTVVNSANNYSYVFNYTDHLGNVRLSYSDTDKNGSIATTEIVDESNYYPFGLKHTGYNGYVATDYKYKFNGKELQDELGLNMYDYGARNYDPALGRWMNIDPLAETSRRFSPYTYALNNPVFFIDPDGMQADDWKKDAKGNLTYDENLTKENASTQLKKGESYVGKTATENISNDAGNYTITYNEDGSMSSSNPTKGTTGDGLVVYGVGGDAVAGSSDLMPGDRGSGAIDADTPGGDIVMLTDFVAMLFGVADSAISWIGDFNKRQASWDGTPSSAPPGNEVSNDTTISVSETHYYDYTNPHTGKKSIEPRVTTTKDTTVHKTDVNRVNANQNTKNQNNYKRVK